MVDPNGEVAGEICCVGLVRCSGWSYGECWRMATPDMGKPIGNSISDLDFPVPFPHVKSISCKVQRFFISQTLNGCGSEHFKRERVRA